ncbi:hypothetical protein [Tsuneonella suprasediminis]|uniref:hypothetical protein n=1 Tax=Tsuneonella suprasediminis TaxID=2306996 RepID=UPI002F959D61
MIDAKFQGASTALAAITAAAGFAAPWPVVGLGFWFALAGGFGAMAVNTPKAEDRLGIWATALVALVMGAIFGLAYPLIVEITAKFFTAVPTLPLVMAIGGTGSRPLLRWFAHGGWTALLDRFTGKARS